MLEDAVGTLASPPSSHLLPRHHHCTFLGLARHDSCLDDSFDAGGEPLVDKAGKEEGGDKAVSHCREGRRGIEESPDTWALPVDAANIPRQ